MTRRIAFALLLAALASALVDAHSGPPFPIVSNRFAGGYDISIWTDPDSTDDGSAEGKFWVVLARADGKGDVPQDTRATVTIHALDRQGPELSAAATPENGSAARQYAALVMDHEGRYAVVVSVEGPLGRAAADATVDATYDLRPQPYLLAVYLAPFLAIGALWVKLLRARRKGR